MAASLRYGVALVLGRLQRLVDVTVEAGRSVSVEGPAGDPVQMDGDVAGALPLSVSLDNRSAPCLVRA